MVTQPKKYPFRPRRERGALTTDLLVGMAILLLAIFPLAYSVIQEARLMRAGYWRGVVMEIVDGEMEILAAGEWRAFPEGAHSYPVTSVAAEKLPAGKFQLTRTGSHLRLEWRSDELLRIGPVIREVTVK